MTKLEQMQMKLSQLVTDMQSKIDKDDIDGATAVRDEIKALQDKIEAQIFLDEIQNKNFKKKAGTFSKKKLHSKNNLNS